MNRTVRTLLPAVLAAALTSVLVGAGPSVAKPDKAAFPDRIELPDSFQPEGIAIGPGPTAWLGSLADGGIYEVSLRTGRGEVVSEGTGVPAAGLKSDKRGRLFVAGADSGTARVVDSGSGDVVVDYDLNTDGGFVNDVVLTKRAAWFTDSAAAQLYRVDLGKKGAPSSKAATVPLTGEWVQGEGFGANGISTTPDGKALLVINSTSGLLYRVDPATGSATQVDVTGVDDGSLMMGDGMLRQGRTLYVVRNRINTIAAVRLDRSGTRGTVTRTITDDDFDVPTTVARFGSRLYLPNARFGTDPTPTTDYWVTQVRARPKR